MAMATRIWVKKTRLIKYFRKLIKNFNLHKDIKKDAGCRLSVVRNKKNVQNSPDLPAGRQVGVTSFLVLAEALRRHINPKKIEQTAGQHFLT